MNYALVEMPLLRRFRPETPMSDVESPRGPPSAAAKASQPIAPFTACEARRDGTTVKVVAGGQSASTPTPSCTS
jgi:hypothetical protein